jgi:diacylglycerol kinase (ATP)
MKIRFIINPRDAASMAALRDAAVELRSKGHEVSGWVTFEAGDAECFARRSISDGVDLVLAAGGDGTIFEVANGLLTGDPAAAMLPRLAVVPLGTANDLANGLFYPTEVPEAIRYGVESEFRPVDIARVNDRYFVNVSTGGFGADATEDAPEMAKRTIGILAYLAQGVKKLASLTPLSARFSIDDEVIHDGEFLLFGVGNGGRTGGGNWITPKADMTDGLLDLCIVLPMSRSDFVRLAPDLRSGDHVGNANVIYRQLPRVLIEGPDVLRVNADGEPVDGKSLLYTIRPGALQLPIPGEAP